MVDGMLIFKNRGCAGAEDLQSVDSAHDRLGEQPVL